MTETTARKFSLTATYLPETQSADAELLGFCVKVHVEAADAPRTYLGMLVRSSDGYVFCDAHPTNPDRGDSEDLSGTDFLSLGETTLTEIVSALTDELSSASRTVEPVTLAVEDFARTFDVAIH